MPAKVQARDGDCLCVIAMENGFLNCQALRREPKNHALLNRPLKNGDVVTIPDLDLKNTSKPTDKTHKFKKQNAPPVSIRYVRDSSDKSSLTDPELQVLNVSNYPTDIGGAFANVPFPDSFGFNVDGQVDPDAFKVEVVDPAAGGQTINVEMEALRPVYKVDDEGKLNVAGHQTLPGSPTSFMQCAPLPSGGGAFRSKYLRIVTQREDNDLRLEQTLLATSLADGKGTGQPADVDGVEILDFEIRATYVIARCPAPAKCKVRVVRPLGDESEQQRFRIAFHIFKKRATGQAVGSLTVQKVRRTALTHLRNFYAQTSLAPKLVSADAHDPNGPPIIFVPEPDNSMITIGSADGGASGHNAQHQASTLTVFDDQIAIGKVTFTEKMNPRHVAAAIVDAIDPISYTAKSFKNPKSDRHSKNNPYDVLVTRVDQDPVNLRVATDDTRLSMNITVVRVDLDAISPGDQAQLRRVCRSSPGPAGAINVYAIGKNLDSATNAASGAHTLAFSAPVRNSYQVSVVDTQARQFWDSILCEAHWLDDPAPLPMVLPHECGHVLGKVMHVDTNDPHFRTEMMTPNASSSTVSGPNPTHISDFPILVNYELQDDGTRLVNITNRMRTIRPDLLEAW